MVTSLNRTLLGTIAVWGVAGLPINNLNTWKIHRVLWDRVGTGEILVVLKCEAPSFLVKGYEKTGVPSTILGVDDDVCVLQREHEAGYKRESRRRYGRHVVRTRAGSIFCIPLSAWCCGSRGKLCVGCEEG